MIHISKVLRSGLDLRPGTASSLSPEYCIALTWAGNSKRNWPCLSLLIKVNRSLWKELLLVFINHYEECHISRSLSSLADIEADRPIGACPKRETGDRVFSLCQLSVSGKSCGTKAPTAPLPTLATAIGYELRKTAVDALIPGIRELYLPGIHSSPLSGKSE